MSEFTMDMQTFKPSYPFLDFETNMELMNHFPDLNPSVTANSNLNFQCFMGFSNDNFLVQQAPEFPGNLAENLPCIFHPDDKNVMLASEPIISAGSDFPGSKKRKAMDVSESSSGNPSPPDSENGIRRKNSSGRGKKVKINEIEGEKLKEVVHVRARRGQATDSHSLAERVRRGKINERIKCLKDIVPGCYKTMGMAVMLDEIINYVHSLQNQVEFLSMKLTAASKFYDFNLETDAMKTMQGAKSLQGTENAGEVREGYEGVASNQLGPFDPTFGCYPSLPYDT
ncbi:hypothetical protein F0562_025161 [Nyssa sinensis]|uniref:BHLH domain-containing protein n=1 Tax=Nyssa sinensis TaxID=561372 RepID=A0A5J5BHK3_9ASTE|nr:hypothetical protein F0562_025161 [Nyssa sinensis]